MPEWISGVSGLSPGEVADTTGNVVSTTWDGYQRALGGGLVDPSTGTPAITDPSFDGPVVPNDNVLEYAREGIDQTTEDAAYAGGDAAGELIDGTVSLAGDVLPTNVKVLLVGVLGLAGLWLLRPFVSVLDMGGA